MHFRPTELHGSYIIELRRFTDERGAFVQIWDRAAAARHGLPERIELINESFNRARGTLRGMHFQRQPYAQAKLIRCLRGAIYDVIIDLRPDSPSFTRWVGVELHEADDRMLYVPAGFAHGFQTLEDDTRVEYQVSEVYVPEAESGYRYDDPAFGIGWPLPVSVISPRDQAWLPYQAERQASS